MFLEVFEVVHCANVAAPESLVAVKQNVIWERRCFSIMSRDIFRVNESFRLRRPLRVMEAITQAFVNAERGRFDSVCVGLLPFRWLMLLMGTREG